MSVLTGPESDQLIASLRQRGLLGAPAQVLDNRQAATASNADQAPAQLPRPAADQPQRGQRADFSTHQPPVEKPAHACGTVHLYRLPGRRLRAQRLDCRTKGCPRCGPRLRAAYAMGYTTVLAAAGRLYRLQLPDAGWRRLQAKLQRRGAQVLRIPSPAGRLTVYTTADDQGGYLVDDDQDLADLLAADFAAMPSDRRNVSASRPWREAYHAWQEAQQPEPSSDQGEWLGPLGRPLEHLAIITRDLGMLERQTANSLVLRDPPDAETWHRFCALARLRHPRED